MISFPEVNTLGELFHKLAQTRPESVALCGVNDRIETYKELNSHVLKLCAVVTAKGIQPGARVAVLSKNCIELAETFGLARQGLIVVPLNWRLAPEEIHALLDDCSPEAIFVDRTHLSIVREHLGNMPQIKLLGCYDGQEGEFVAYEDLLASPAEAVPEASISASDPLCIIYTSGTTGRPKGAILSHGGALANMRMALAELLQLRAGDRVLATMPFFHVGGLWYHFFASVASGCETTILPEFDPATVLDVLATDRVSVVHLVPTMVSALISSEEFEKKDLTALRRVFYAGSPMPTALLRRAMKALPDCEFLQAYGSTEAGVISALTPVDHQQALLDDSSNLLQSCGRPVEGAEVRISDAGGPQNIGEIEVRSQAVILGYWNNPEASDAIRSGDWVRTGDLGYLDQDGYLFLVDRKNDMIVTGGENVYPTEVEEHLARIQGVSEAAVFSTPHPRWIEQVTAAVVPVEGTMLDEAALIARLKVELAHYKCPKRIFFTQELPKNGVGKVLRARLRDRYQSKEGS